MNNFPTCRPPPVFFLQCVQGLYLFLIVLLVFLLLSIKAFLKSESCLWTVPTGLWLIFHTLNNVFLNFLKNFNPVYSVKLCWLCFWGCYELINIHKDPKIFSLNLIFLFWNVKLYRAFIKMSFKHWVSSAPWYKELVVRISMRIFRGSCMKLRVSFSTTALLLPWRPELYSELWHSSTVLAIVSILTSHINFILRWQHYKISINVKQHLNWEHRWAQLYHDWFSAYIPYQLLRTLSTC